ncbi:MAG TPA: methyl-accepting chemotaxis protein [Longimicrobiales bacterium]|nr:methyl-accepting chemotaxis protein [Longimicrobiales bacterium]
MTWTVSRRIILGYAIAVLLLAGVATIAVRQLEQTRTAFGTAMTTENVVLRHAQDAMGALRTSNVEYLRILVERSRSAGPARDSAVTAARSSFVSLVAEDPAQAEGWREAQQLFEEWVQQTDASMEAMLATDLQESLQVRRTAAQTRVEVESRVDELVRTLRARVDDITETADATGRNSQTAIVIAFAIALLAMIISAWLLNRAVSKPLQETSNVLATSAAEILATTTEQASGATESMAAVTQTAATVDQVVQTAEQAAERARAVAASAQRAAEIGRQGREAVELSSSAMDQVSTQVDTIGASILELAEQAQAIGEIITTVNDLAEQTNLLALNAAIEAARAGEQGRGFSVVAGEVRALAEQSKTSTVRVRQILGEIQRATSAAVMATEQGNKQVEQGAKQVREAGETIRKLAEAVQAASQAAAQISASASQQSTGMAQIKQAVGSIQQAAQQNLAATRQAEAAARELNRLGTQLTGLVGSEARRPSAA